MPDDSEKKKGGRGIPTISRVSNGTLVELVFDAEKQKTALAISRFGGLWNVEAEVTIDSGERLVPYAATNNLIANECVLLPSVPEDFGFKDDLIADIRAFLHRYVDLSKGFEEIAAYYVLLTWVHDAFNELPYLRLRGDYGTGKTRALMALGHLCYRAFFASGASTVSPIFHTLDAFGGTLILDEADLPFSDARVDLVKILNNGTVKGMPVLRSVVNRHREFNPYAFKVFGPKIIATREQFEDRALESRFLTENTGEHSLRPDIPISLPKSFKTDALQLRNRLLHYRFSHYFDIKTDSTALIADAEPRLNQMALSLLSLVDDPMVRQRIQQSLLREHAERLADRRDTIEATVLAAVCDVHAKASGELSVGAVTERFNQSCAAELGRSVTNKWIGHVLRNRLRLQTQKSKGVYIIPVAEHAKIEALALRYGIASAPAA